ncbi:MAG: type II toxin-antitoxin system VapC family toxin [Candidatus Nanohalobium sp.]
MDKLFADTDIFGIAVDPDEDRRESVWDTLDEVSNGKYKFFTSEIVLAEIEDNTHKTTREKEKELIDATVDEIVELSEDIIELSDKLVNEVNLGIIDSHILATAILNECTFWTGDYELLNQETTEEIRDVLEEFDRELEFHYKIE